MIERFLFQLNQIVNKYVAPNIDNKNPCNNVDIIFRFARKVSFFEVDNDKDDKDDDDDE